MPSTSATERKLFSDRLQLALKNASLSPDSPTILAREFNAQFDGKPITVHAARKWLVGEAIPTQEKIRTLANWLEIPLEWLRFGTEPNLPSLLTQAQKLLSQSKSKKIAGEVAALQEAITRFLAL